MWKALVEEGPVVGTNSAEVDRLKNVVKVLEDEAENLRQEINNLKAARTSLLAKITDQEQQRQLVVKELLKVKANLNFEVKAREGLAKKTGGFEFEALNLREEKKNLVEELNILRTRSKEMEFFLNQERSKRLQEIHETEILRKQNQSLESKQLQAEQDAARARSELLTKLQKMETIIAENDAQKVIIDTLNHEIMAMNSEIAQLKASSRQAIDEKYQSNRTIAKQEREIEMLTAEVSRLRKQYLTSAADTQTRKSSAFLPSPHRHSQSLSSDSLDHSILPKSRFVGSGLGLRTSMVPEFNPQGSAKSIVRKVLQNREDEF